jgi:hypothetical protein
MSLPASDPTIRTNGRDFPSAGSDGSKLDLGTGFPFARSDTVSAPLCSPPLSSARLDARSRGKEPQNPSSRRRRRDGRERGDLRLRRRPSLRRRRGHAPPLLRAVRLHRLRQGLPSPTSLFASRTLFLLAALPLRAARCWGWCDGASARRSVCFRREKKVFCFRISFCCRRFDAEARALPGSVAQNGGFVYVFLYDCVQRRACGVVG